MFNALWFVNQMHQTDHRQRREYPQNISWVFAVGFSHSFESDLPLHVGKSGEALISVISWEQNGLGAQMWCFTDSLSLRSIYFPLTSSQLNLRQKHTKMVLKTTVPPICYFQVRANRTLNYLVLRTGEKWLQNCSHFDSVAWLDQY